MHFEQRGRRGATERGEHRLTHAASAQANTIHQGTRHHDQKRINLHPVFNHSVLVLIIYLHKGHPAELLGLCVSRADIRRSRHHTGTGIAP